MKILKGYRRLERGEKFELGDQWADLDCGEITSIAPIVSSLLGDTNNGCNEGKAYVILRKIDSPWISFEDRRPTREDADKKGRILVRYTDASEPNPDFIQWDFKTCAASFGGHWMPLWFHEECPPITIQEGSRTHELIFNKDGSIKAGCVTIDKEKMGQIIERWKKEQE